MVTCERLSYQPFNILRTSDLFVDKTPLLNKFLAGRPRHMLITAPRGFGKTTNLDMVRRFVEMDVFPNGTMKTDKTTHKNYKTFAETIPSTGKLLRVFKSKTFFNKHFGEYPTIWLDLNLQGVKTYDRFAFRRLLLNGTIRAAFRNHVYLLVSDVISAKDKELFRKVLHANCSDYSPRDAVGLLKGLLKRHFQRPPIILLDNIDAPLQEIILDPTAQRSDAALRKLYELASFLNGIAFEKETSVRTLSAGTIKPWLGLRSANPRHKHAFYENLISGQFGFNRAEIAALAKTRGSQVDLIEAWYGGYPGAQIALPTRRKTSRSDLGQQTNLNNPYSVLSYFSHKAKGFQPYWTKLESLNTFKLALGPECFGPQVLECFETCAFNQFFGWPLFGQFSLDMSPAETTRLQDLQVLATPALCQRKTLYFFITYMENLGFLSHKGYTNQKGLCYQDYLFKIPNLEVEEYLINLLFEANIVTTPLNGDVGFRLKLFDALVGVESSEKGMESFANALVTLLVASEKKSRGAETSGHGSELAKKAFVHSMRLHLFRPPPSFRVNYVKARAFEVGSKKAPTIFDLVFIVHGVTGLVAFAVKVEVDVQLEEATQVLTEVYSTVLTTGELLNRTKSVSVKVGANLRCNDDVCQLCYVYNNRGDLAEDNCLKVEKESVSKNSKKR